MEFGTTSRLADLFSVSSSKNYTVQVLSKQTVTVEVMQLKRSMYEDSEEFIFKHFDILCNLLKNFNEFDTSLKISALKVVLQVSEKMVSSLSVFLDEEELDKEETSRNRNILKMTIFLLCHFTNAFETEVAKILMAANIGKGRKRKVSVGSELSEWPEQRVKILVIVKKLFKLPIHKLWDPPTVESEFMNFVTITLFKLLETTDVAKDEGIRTEIFRFLGTVLKEYRTGLVYSVKIIQLVQDYEHLPSVLAEGVIYFVKECSADTLISDIVREATLLDMDVLTQNLTAAHSLSQFLVLLAEECSEKFLPLMSLILQFLEWESHVIRNCSLSIIGILLSKPLCSENLSEKEKKVREELLGHVEAHLLDANSFVRCRSIQVLKMLLEEKALASVELYEFGRLITKRLKDKASNVRKNAMSFMALFIEANQLACQVPLPVLKESYQNEMEKLKELKKSAAVIFDDSDDEKESEEQRKANAVIFDDSDEELSDEKDGGTGEKNNGDNPSENAEEGVTSSSKENSEDVKTSEEAVMEVQENTEPASDQADPSNTVEALKKQQTLVQFLKNTLQYFEVIHSISEPIRALLHSSTQTDILEAIEFVTVMVNNSIEGAEVFVKEVLKLVWSKEVTVRETVLNAFKNLYLSNGTKECNPSDVAKNLIRLLNGATVDDALCIQEFVKHFSQLRAIPKSVPNILWTTFSTSDVTEEKVPVLQLLGMLSEISAEVILMRLENFIEISLEKMADKGFLLAMYAMKALGKVNQNISSKLASESQEEIRLPHSHLLVSRIKYFLIDGIKNYEDDQWICMSDEAVKTIFSLIEEPTMLCAEISIKLVDILCEEMDIEKTDKIIDAVSDDMSGKKIPHVLLCRFLAFCGHVAIHYMTYLKVNCFGYLRRQEAIREKRRRRSSVNAHVSSLQSTSFISPQRKSSKKRRSFHKAYKLVPPVDEETTYEQIIEILANDAKDENKLMGRLIPFVIGICRWTLMVFNKEVQAAASLSLAKIMLLSEQMCEENMQLFATIAEKSPEPYIRANMMMAMGDLTTAYPNIVEPWTQQIFQGLKDSNDLVRENAIIILTHLILHDFVRIKGLISEAAKCIADKNPTISSVAKFLFSELSRKGNVIYNIIPDIISSLSDPKSGIDEETFQTVLRYMLQYVEKEKLVEGLVEKLCCRFSDSSTEIQIHELTFCLSILTLNDKCYSKLMEFKNLLKERMSDPIVMKYITNITANAKKNDAKTAAELEAFRKELGI